MPVPPRPWMNAELEALRDTVVRFIGAEITPKIKAWSDQGHIDRDLWRRAGDLGLLCTDVAEEHGGIGGDITHEALISMELVRGGGNCFRACRSIHVIAAHYVEAYGTAEQKARWLPGLCSGELIAGMGMTEPGGGSDLQNTRTKAVRCQGGYLVNGSKTFITNGSTADLLVLAVKTDPKERAKGMSLILFDTKTAGFRVGQRLDKVGLHYSDTCELFFDDCEVPEDALLGGVEGRGFYQMMEQLPYERAMIAVAGAANVQYAYDLTLDYTREREAFGKRIIEFQNTRFELAEIKTDALVSRLLADHVIERMRDGTADAEVLCMAKFWLTDKQSEVVDRCLQLFGGYGYMMDYPIGRLYADGRIERIYGGTNEIMKELIGRSL
ncbi:acyl-CoA dehydrogenase family protein [Zavarzinia compransoris]|uniref:Acyl-CoA dehydrogenase n=1 Tax=Zavarzinia compransoris TaxID=1264899 RepID=A0A317EA33_9PROT|nr:acyl-CoA dehydrogenase family protein [Zavarzinia compransoris]PWR22005.1 acyl-CoA dehydrogenase [Zavarzinia compransoris]TDP47256.1 acyl-CoA dehydrogenase [Zavarzinia compransoris]